MQKTIQALGFLVVIAGLFLVLYGWMVPPEYQAVFLAGAAPALLVVAGALVARRLTR